MITDNVRNLFQFIEFLHSNIENFNQYSSNILEWEIARARVSSSAEHISDIVEKRKLQAESDEKWSTIYLYIIKPIEEKALELNIFNSNDLEICYNDALKAFYNDFIYDILTLIEDFKDEDIVEIFNIQRQYVEFKSKISIHKIYSSIFETLDEIILPIDETFREKKIKSTQKSQNITLDIINGHNLTLVINEEEYRRIVEEFNFQETTSITGKVKLLFIFIGFLHSNITNFKKYDSILKEIEELRKEFNSLGQINNYKDRMKENELVEKLRSKSIITMNNISIPIRDIAAYLDIYDLSMNSNVWDWSIGEVEELRENLILEDVPVIQKYGQMYAEYRETVNNDYGWIQFFKDLDKTLDYLFSFYSDSKATVDVAEKPNDSNKKKSPQIKSLFSFIEFLYANIDNFNQYDNGVLELNKTVERYYQLGFHYTNVREKRILQKEINEIWDVIFKNIVNPIKDKVAELDLFDWNELTTLPNNYFDIANTLSKTYDEKDLDAILKAKRQYIEFTNEISPRVIKQAERMFEYLYKVMFEIAKNFEEKGDKPIKKIKVKQVDTFQELVESFKAGEIASLPLHINSSDTVSIQSDINVPHSDAENNVQLIEQTTQDKREEGTKSRVSHVTEAIFKEVESKTEERIIDKEELALYFKSNFKKENPVSYFNMLVEELKTDRSKKEFGKIAYMIYKSEHVNNRMPKNNFNKWFQIFSNCISIGESTYKKGVLKDPSHNLKQLFNYL